MPKTNWNVWDAQTRKAEPLEKHAVGDECPWCKKGVLCRVKDCSPAKEDYLICDHCDSTYLLKK